MLSNFLVKLLIFATLLAATTFFATHGTGPAVLRSAVTPKIAIAALLADRDRYANSAVQVSGVVVPQGRVGALGYGVFRLGDETGMAITVVSHDTGAPPTGINLAVMGVLAPNKAMPIARPTLRMCWFGISRYVSATWSRDR
jgi:hypothetical protein